MLSARGVGSTDLRFRARRPCPPSASPRVKPDSPVSGLPACSSFRAFRPFSPAHGTFVAAQFPELQLRLQLPERPPPGCPRDVLSRRSKHLLGLPEDRRTVARTTFLESPETRSSFRCPNDDRSRVFPIPTPSGYPNDVLARNLPTFHRIVTHPMMSAGSLCTRRPSVAQRTAGPESPPPHRSTARLPA
jgi:hypothetical protein